MDQAEVEYLKNQLSTARKEIRNLRQQVSTLSRVHQKDLQNIKNVLQTFRCQNCKNVQGTEECPTDDLEPEGACNVELPKEVVFNPIGVIKTVFAEKRAVPRQSNLATKLLSRIELYPSVFNNPEHSLEGLEKFSHIWLVYHFHKNQSHLKAKIAPPRLGGEKVGVFSTRSPHRPCPIGLSLVQLDRIENSKVYFYGTDMVDDTPVLDIKPYIPQYDVPKKIEETEFYTAREAPDGEETNRENAGASTSNNAVKVPNWILNNSSLRVVFNDNAVLQTRDLGIDKNSIAEILKADPRSVYLRTKYGSQIYTFQLGENTVTCKFDDNNSTVNVLQVRKVINLQDITPTATAASTNATIE